MKVKSFSHVQLLATPWTVTYQAPPSMGFFRQEYWSGVPLPSPIKDSIIYQIELGKLSVNSGSISQFIKVNTLIIINIFQLITIGGT